MNMVRRLGAGILIALVSGCGGGRKQASTMTPEVARKDPSAEASTVSADDAARRPQESPLALLQGRVAGVVVGLNDAGQLAVRMRGAISNTGRERPLYLIDGVRFDPGPNGTLLGINPSDIESIRALKDPADLTFYGMDGANGVILITTKQGKKR